MPPRHEYQYRAEMGWPLNPDGTRVSRAQERALRQELHQSETDNLRIEHVARLTEILRSVGGDRQAYFRMSAPVIARHNEMMAQREILYENERHLRRQLRRNPDSNFLITEPGPPPVEGVPVALPANVAYAMPHIIVAKPNPLFQEPPNGNQLFNN